MGNFLVAGIGELLWDVLPQREVLGGAPVNFAYHAAALGATGVPISAIGKDRRGDAALDLLGERGLDIRAISRVDQPTGYVAIEVDSAGIANYRFPAEAAWDHLQLNSHAARVAEEARAVCFGTLAQRAEESRRVIQSFLDGLPGTTLRVFDINLRQHFYGPEVILASLARCDILKLNSDELPVVMDLLSLRGEPEPVLSEIRARYGLALVVYTRGGEGSLLLSASDSSDHPGIPVEVVDSIGAGDCFTAAATIGFLQQRPLAEINELANRLAAYVCSQVGAMPPVPAALQLV